MKEKAARLLAVLLVFCMLGGICVPSYADDKTPAPDTPSVISETSDTDTPDSIPAEEVPDSSSETIDSISSALSSADNIPESDSAADTTSADLNTAEIPDDTVREAQEFSFDDCLESLDVIISDANGEHKVSYKESEAADLDLGEIQRNATLSITLAFNPNVAAGNEGGTANPIIDGDSFTCAIPDILSNSNGGKWSGRLKDETTNYGKKNGSIGDFLIENGKLTITFDNGYIEETGGNIKNASLNFTGNFDAYGWDEESFTRSLYFGNLPVNIRFPAANVLRNLSIEKTPVNYGNSEFSAQGKRALNGTAKIDADGYVTYSIKVTAATDNTSVLENVVISDIFTTDNVNPSSVVLLSVVKGVKDTDITKDVIPQIDENDNITGWNVGTLNRGEEATVTFKIKIDKDKITEDVDDAKGSNPDSSAADARLLKNTASAIADKMANPVTTDAAATLQNYILVSKSKDGSYDPTTGRQKFTITITAPSDNKYTEHNVYIRDYQDSGGNWMKDIGISDITIKHADGTETKSTEDTPLYNNFTIESSRAWHAYLDELAPGDVATIHTYVDIDTSKWYTEGANYSSNGIKSVWNYIYAGSGDLSQSSTYCSYSISKTWISKTGSYSAEDGSITWTMTGNTYSSNLPDANIEGMTVTDTLDDKQDMADTEVLVTFYEPVSGKVRPYIGENAKDGKLAVTTTDTGFTFVIPEGYGDCRYSVTYKTKVKNNYGPSADYYNTGKLGIWSCNVYTRRPRIASIDKQYVERGADWASWAINILGPVNSGDAITDTISTSTDYMWVDEDNINDLTITFNGKAIDKSLYNVVMTQSADGRGKGFTLTFLGAITDTDAAGREITPTTQNPAVISYKTHLNFPTNAAQTQYYNSSSLTVDGKTIDTSYDYFYRSTNPEITKKYKETVGSNITWTVRVNKSGYGCYLIDENKNPIYYKNNGDGPKSGYYAIITETIPEGLKYVNAKYGNSKGYYANTPTIEKLSEEKNDDGSTTVKLLIGNLMHYEGAPNYTSQYYNNNSYYYVDIDIITQIIDKECLLDTTGKNFEWNNTASLTSMDGQPYEASAAMNIAHTALEKKMVYDGSTAPNAFFTIEMNKECFDLNPDGDTIKIFDTSSSSLVVDTSSIKVVDATNSKPVDYILDAGQMAADGTFALEVPDDKPLLITYNAGVSGVTGDEVTIKNNVYFEGQNTDSEFSSINQVVVVLNAAAQAQSDVMIWLHKSTASGQVLPGCIFKLEQYTADDGWITVKDDIVSEDASMYGTKLGGLEKNTLYRLTETEAADNYILDQKPQYFCLKVSQDSKVDVPEDFTEDIQYCTVAANINAYNSPYVPVTFRKNDENGSLLAGASFKVTDKDGKIIKDKNGKDVVFSTETITAPSQPEDTDDDDDDSSTVTTPTFYIAPGTYTLVETTPPAGYLPSADITFTANTDKTVSVDNKRVENNTVICTDTPTSVVIRKLDGSVTPNPALSDAVLQILDGRTVKEEWTTDGVDYTITGVLDTGKTYTLHEATAPDGYLLADDIHFSINADGTINSTSKADDGALVMIDNKPSLDIVKINKTKNVNLEANAPLAGVSLTMTQGDTAIRTWTTTVDADDPTIAVAEHFDNLEAGKTYTITENSAPAGYQKISPFTVTPNTDGTFTISGKDASYADGILTIKNEYVPTPVDVTLTVHKQITGAPPVNKTFTFELKETNSDTKETISIIGEGDGSFAKKTFTQAGTYTYTISEAAGSDNGYTYAAETHNVVITITDDGKGTLSKKVTIDGTESTETTITNTYTPLQTTLSIPVVKMISEDSADRPEVSDFTFTIEGKTGNEPLPTVKEITANEEEPGAFGNITFTEVGIYEYTISEVDDEKAGYTYADSLDIKVDVKDFDGQLGSAWYINEEAQTEAVFTNTYQVESCTVNLNAEKKIEGTGYPKNTVFRFEIKPEKDAPAPSDSLITITGEGTASSKDITFTKVGTYVYTIAELNDKVPNFTYDNSVQTVTFTVTDEDAVLKAICTIDEKESDTAIFTNRYTAPISAGTTPTAGPVAAGTGTASPGTGDNHPLPFGALLASGIALAMLLNEKKHRRA